MPRDSDPLVRFSRITKRFGGVTALDGIETVYQDLAFVDSLDAAGNIFLGRELLRFRLGPVRVLDARAMDGLMSP